MTLAPLAALLLSATPANRQQAADLFHQSATEYELGNFEAALVDIAKAYRLDPRPALLYNLGQCHRALHHWERAAFFYDEYLVKTPDAPNRAAVERLITEMRAELKAQKATALPQPVAAPAPPPRPAPVAASAAPPVAAVPAPAPAPAPAEAVTEAPPPARHSHWLGATLVTAAAICAGFAIYGAVRVYEYNQLPTQTTSWTQYDQALGLNYQNTGSWGTAAIALGIAAAGGVTGAILTW